MLPAIEVTAVTLAPVGAVGSTGMTVELIPIADPDMAVVAALLNANLNARVPAHSTRSRPSIPRAPVTSHPLTRHGRLRMRTLPMR